MIDANTNTPTSNDNNVPRIALRPKDAEKSLGVGDRKLWELTNHGLIPHGRLPDSKCILYPVDLLRDWLAEQVEKKRGDR